MMQREGLQKRKIRKQKKKKKRKKHGDQLEMAPN